LLRSLPHALDCLHDAFLLRQESIPEIRRPVDVSAQALENVGQHHQGLDAGVPWLCGSRIRQPHPPAPCR
jgi:hypothetical protein